MERYNFQIKNWSIYHFPALCGLLGTVQNAHWLALWRRDVAASFKVKPKLFFPLFILILGHVISAYGCRVRWGFSKTAEMQATTEIRIFTVLPKYARPVEAWFMSCDLQEQEIFHVIYFYKSERREAKNIFITFKLLICCFKMYNSSLLHVFSSVLYIQRTYIFACSFHLCFFHLCSVPKNTSGSWTVVHK